MFDGSSCPSRQGKDPQTERARHLRVRSFGSEVRLSPYGEIDQAPLLLLLEALMLEERSSKRHGVPSIQGSEPNGPAVGWRVARAVPRRGPSAFDAVVDQLTRQSLLHLWAVTTGKRRRFSGHACEPPEVIGAEVHGTLPYARHWLRDPPRSRRRRRRESTCSIHRRGHPVQLPLVDLAARESSLRFLLIISYAWHSSLLSFRYWACVARSTPVSRISRTLSRVV